MKAVKLSKTQQELADAMRSGVRVVYMRYMGSFNPRAYYFRTDTNARVTAAALALLRLDVAERVNQKYGDHDLAIKQEVSL